MDDDIPAVQYLRQRVIPSNLGVPGERLKVVDKGLGALALRDPLHVLNVATNQAKSGHRLDLD